MFSPLIPLKERDTKIVIFRKPLINNLVNTINAKIVFNKLLSSQNTKIIKIRPLFKWVLMALWLCLLNVFEAKTQTPDSTKHISLAVILNDSLNKTQSDTSIVSKADSVKKDTINISKDAIQSKVEYSARDSIRFDLANKKVYLFGDAQVKYEEITLKSAYIEINWIDNTVYAEGVTDSLGKITGKPEFTEGTESFKALTLKYNFTTKKGKIKEIIAKEGDSYIHGLQVKKLSNDDLYIKSGKYTTCDLEHPHYEIFAMKLKIIKNDKIVTGPAYLAVADVPTPLALPFGFFPNKKGQTSGILIPSYGYSQSQGYYLSKGGYYFGFSDFFDDAITADAYTKGSWQLSNLTNYKKRYKYYGSVNFSRTSMQFGEKQDADYYKTTGFIFQWKHNQDSKAKPNSTFAADVKFGTSNYYTNNLQNTTEYLNNNYTSNISYSHNFQWFNITTSARHNQITKTHAIDVTLPEFNLTSTKDIYFLKWSKTVPANKFLASIQDVKFRYSINARNQISTVDSLLFNPEFQLSKFFNYFSDSQKGFGPSFLSENALSKLKNGIQLNPSIALPTLSIFKYFKLNSGLSYTGRVYFKQIYKHTLADSVITDTLNEVHYVHDYGFTASLSTTIYGTKVFKNDVVKGIRHTISPLLSFAYNPSFGTDNSSVDYYGTYNKKTDTDTGVIVKQETYSKYADMLYGTAPQYKSGKVRFSLGNRLEIKVRTKNDSIPTYVNVPIFESLSISTAYDLAKDSLNLDPISINARTSFLKNKIQLSYTASYDPYVMDTNGVRSNQFEWTKNHRLARFSNSSSSLVVGLNLTPPSAKNKSDKTSTKASEGEINDINKNPGAYVDFTIPWKLNISYNYKLGLTRQANGAMDSSITHSITCNGELSITPKWKVTFATGYDLKNKKPTPTNFTFYRDLHCWEMSLYVVPFGTYKSYEFKISVKAQVLQDLKLNRKRGWYDQQE